MALDRKAVSWYRQFGYITLACLCFLLFQGQFAFGQVDEGSIAGTIQDTTGAVVPGAQVTLLNTDQGTTLQTRSGGNGEYSFSPVRIGHYSLTATAKGFSKTTQENLVVAIAQHLTVNVQLKPGAATETVEVTTAPPLMQTEEASVGQVITQESVNSLPLNGRNFTFLAQLGAGMQTPQADTRGNAASGAFSANGLRPAQNNYLLDGIDNNSNAVDFLNGTNFVILPPLDAIQEFKVQTADFSAELGRSAGAVLNATIKSGTNSLHGAAWEFFRNDKLDAADWFEDNGGIPKGELRMNQFGASAGGPIIKNKIFFFGDYEGLRRVQGTASSGSVPTATEVSSGFTNLTDILTQAGTSTRTDLLGRTVPAGTILDPRTTRGVLCGVTDPVTNIPGPPCISTITTGTIDPTGTNYGYVRDPFTNGAAGCTGNTTKFSAATCGLNNLPKALIDQTAVKLLGLYPSANSGLATYTSSPNLFEHRNAFDTRFDINPTAKEQIYVRFSYSDDPQFIPGIFGGIADGGAFQQGLQTAKSDQAAMAWTHVFTPNTINVARAGFAHLHTTRYGPEGGTMGIPATYGINSIPQVSENGGLPGFSIGNLSTLGSNNFLPSDEVSQTLQVTDDFTKIYGKHSFKAGFELQHVKFSTLQPAWSRGQFQYSGTFTDIPNLSNTTGGLAQLVLPPMASTVGSTDVPYSGGSDFVYASNINKTYDAKNYFAGYLQDDWKISPKLTINLGVRWDYFGPINETNGGQANFIQTGPPGNKPEYLIPASGKDVRTLSTSFTTLLAKDGITLNSTDSYGQGLLQTQKGNVAPRVGFAYQATPKLVVRGGFGLFYNSFENQGYGPNIGENYPFVYNFKYGPIATGNLQQVAPTSNGTPYAGCATAGLGGIATFESGFSCIQFDPTKVNASQLGLQGLQFDYQTPRTYSANFTLQYSLTRTLSAQASYVFTDGQDLQAGIGNNEVSQVLPAGTGTTSYIPFPDFASNGSNQVTVGGSQYHGLQTKLEQQYANGLSFLLTYTFSKTMGDAGDLLNGGNTGGYRAPWVTGLGPKFDWAPADFDIRQVVHFSGGYNLPLGKDKRFLNQGKLLNDIVGNWSTNWIVTLQGGQPLNFGCPTGTTAGTNCNDIRVAGAAQGLKMSLRPIDGGMHPFWINNAAAFNQPCELGANGPIVGKPAGCSPLTGNAVMGSKPGQTVTPGFHRLDYSMFKAIPINDRFSMQFRAEFFNLFNHPNFNAPNFGGNGVVAIGGSGNFTDPHFGEVGSTRDDPYDPRQIQFALKLYY